MAFFVKNRVKLSASESHFKVNIAVKHLFSVKNQVFGLKQAIFMRFSKKKERIIIRSDTSPSPKRCFVDVHLVVDYR